MPSREIIRRDFDSIGEYVDRAARPVDYFRNNSHTSQATERPEFHGTPTFEDALDLARSGWTDGREYIAKLAERLNGRLSALVSVPEVRYDVTGDFLDIGRFVSDEPEDFGTLVDTQVRVDAPVAKIVRMRISTGARFSVAPSSYFIRGAAAIALADVLERKGCRVEIMAYTRSESYSDHISTYTYPLKHENQPLDIDACAFFLAHISSHRRINFANREQESEHDRKLMDVPGAYGKSQSLPEAEKGDIHLGALVENWTEQQAFDWIVSQLRSQGIEVEGDEVRI